MPEEANMKHKMNISRRKLLLGAIALPAAPLLHAAARTPASYEGPFYPTPAMRHDDVDNDLVKITGLVQQAGGEIVRLEGRVLDSNGVPLAGARVEIWQCDVNGRYLHSRDFGWTRRDSGFQGFGHDIAQADGSYAFRTIKPVPYTGRTPHIHLKVLLAGEERLVTQLYLPDHPGNARDFLYKMVPSEERERVTMVFDEASPEPLARLDLVV